jgi:hypothetical protein
MIEIFESILRDKEKMKFFESDPVRHATFWGVYDYVKSGNKLSDIPWFSSLNLKVVEDALDMEKAA